MHDLRLLRQDPAAFDAGLARRGLAPLAESLLARDAARRAALTEAQDIQTRRNALSKEIGARKGRGEDIADLLAQVSGDKDAQAAAEDRAREEEQALHLALQEIPNLPSADVPEGKDESANVEIRRAGTLPQFPFTPREHFAIGESLGLMDFDQARKISGARFVVLKGALARLSRALGAFMLDHQTQNHGYQEILPPFLVRDEALFGTGQLPKFAEDLFQSGDHWLIPTAEVPLTNLVRETILDESALPQRYVALTPCFRAEAGAAGRDTHGMIRQHQFDKVELVSITRPEESEAEHERMTQAAESILQALELPYRVMLLCGGDMGFSARKTYDLEVWLPGQGRYREISSCSHCGDFQARRMGARFRPKEGDPSPRFVHTLNGSGLAVGRTLIAVLENGQQGDGTVRLPRALHPYMGGQETIAPEG